jgi:antitoxin component of RelBE/YafQ-DinJ toxin-antitoxin module
LRRVVEIVVAASPEIRFRLDRAEQEQFEKIARAIGMDANDMVKVFIRRSIAAGGFPFEMRSANDAQSPAERLLPVHGVSVDYLSNIGARAAKAAHLDHIQAGRLPPSTSRDGKATH